MELSLFLAMATTRSRLTLGSSISEHDDMDKLDCSAAGMYGLVELHRSQITKKYFIYHLCQRKGLHLGVERTRGSIQLK